MRSTSWRPFSGYGTITAEMVAQLGTVTLDADTFDMVKLVAAGRTDQAQQKLKRCWSCKTSRS